ncbi:hypothetical protein BDN71DRAFT_1457866, partial [Pleurotus eryngii]
MDFAFLNEGIIPVSVNPSQIILRLPSFCASGYPKINQKDNRERYYVATSQVSDLGELH